MSLFGTKEKLKIDQLKNQLSQLKEKNRQLELENKELHSTLNNKIGQIQRITDSPQEKQIQPVIKSPHEKQFQKITFEFDNMQKENNKLNEIIKNINNKNSLLEQKYRELIQPTSPEISRYKVLVSDIYSSKKYSEFNRICQKLNIICIDELEFLDFNELLNNGYSQIRINQAKNEYILFKNIEKTTEIKKYLVFGDKISTIFSRNKKFISYLYNIGIEYMYQLDNLNLETLRTEKFTVKQIVKFSETLQNYNDLRRI